MYKVNRNTMVLILLALLPIVGTSTPLNLTANRTSMPAGIPTWIQFHVTSPCDPELGYNCPFSGARVDINGFGKPSGYTDLGGYVNILVNPFYVGTAGVNASALGYTNDTLIINATSTPINLTGVINRGVECPILSSDNGNTYTLYNYLIPPAGTIVHVQGILEPGTISFCMQGPNIKILQPYAEDRSHLQKGYINGIITDLNKRIPVQDALVIVNGTFGGSHFNYTTTTDNTGFYELRVNVGDYKISVIKYPLYNYISPLILGVYNNYTTVHNMALSLAEPTECISCHEVTSADLGLHSALSATSAVENSDCNTCHYGSFPMVKGAVNNSNTYFCADCHTATGTSPNKSTNTSVNFTDKKHGQASCMDCHVADGKYHQGNPRGSVANSTYVARYNSTNTVTTDCADCHYAANLDDAPFNAPGGGAHISNLGGSCATGGGSACHAGGSTLIQTFHSISPKDAGYKPTITVPTLSPSTVTQGSEIVINATVSISSLFELVDGAQYRIMSGTTEIQSWTPMSAVGGNFGGSSTVATAMISTNLFSSCTDTIASIEVRGMAGGPAQDPSKRYYPMNGDVSTTKTANLTVLPPMVYLNITVTSGGVPVPYATVRINGNNINDVKTTDTNGNYSFMVPEGTYNVTVSKQPEYYDNTSTIVVTPCNEPIIILPILQKKPTGNIGGSVTAIVAPIPIIPIPIYPPTPTPTIQVIYPIEPPPEDTPQVTYIIPY